MSDKIPNIPSEPTDIVIKDDVFEMELKPIGTSTEVELAEANEWTPEAFDTNILAQVLLPIGDSHQHAVVKKRARDNNNNPIGINNNNPILDTGASKVEFSDGSIDVLSANAIAEAMYSQVDKQGYHHALIKEITYHCKDGSAVHANDGMVAGTQQ